ncbi:conserved hypothetical protein [Rippkaea orientalis PCC 8801]|uniref:Uncharacterized protein n=1 Tax=Rippkaea orientalis (strain PCC 8801 / RF-1) TaxID=41431 RepID=B7JVS8_RIPO1|nr:hypothetical protein [Rippkaea orientalis]ACK64649.1 conserved hypothetical protein [Rippkaea orientalis PCC 8801]
MNHLPQTTRHRLQKISQIPSVWEGDRRSVVGFRGLSDSEGQGKEECIIWVDGSEGFVRAMDIVSPDAGPEAVVRTLLRAIENPHSPAQPARPQKIVVRNRELQFFLRGALQDLQIVIDYVPQLPLIDELFRSFESVDKSRPPALPPNYEPLLTQIAQEFWEAAPWDLLADYDIIALEINHWGVGTIYGCVMGMLGREYGIILYRSLESLKQFRLAALSEKSQEQLEQAFLGQDCWFLNFEPTEAIIPEIEDEEDFDLGDLESDEIEPLFGSVHPYEGIRPFLDEEEAKVVAFSLQAFLRFFEGNQKALTKDPIGKLQKSYRFSHERATDKQEWITIKVSTLPELAAEFLEMIEAQEEEDEDNLQKLQLPIRDDLIPENAFLSLGMIPWAFVETLQNQSKTHYQSQGATAQGEGLPVIVVQTSRPKAKDMIDTLQEEGGLEAICFNPGEDPWAEIAYDLGILQAKNGSLYIFGEFTNDDPEHLQARKKWDKRCQETGGYCGLIVAMGITGSSRGNPQLHDMLALFEAKSLDPKTLAMGVLQLMPQFD